MNKEVGVQRHQLVPELDGTRSIKLILILLYRLSQEMAVVMKDDAKDGNTSQGL
jgi:hypothetical protein